MSLETGWLDGWLEGKSCFMFRSVLWEREVSSLRRTPNFFALEGG